MVNRYHRQILLPHIGETGQKRLQDSHALVVGCGALGSAIVDALARAGAGTISVVDRDTVELTNLQRQTLFDEADVAGNIPKAEAARARVARVNSNVRVHAHVDDFNHRNAERLLGGADLILDGLDNFETRYLVNDLAVKHGLPYVYGGAVATGGMSMTILPGTTPCLRCVFPEAPPPGTTPTCDTAGVLGPAVSMIAAWQVTQAIKILTGNVEAVDRTLLSIDLWDGQIRRFDISRARDTADCPCCAHRRFDWLDGHSGSSATALCGRDAVQITPAPAPAPGTPGNAPGAAFGAAPRRFDLADLAGRLAAHGSFTHNGFLLHGRFDHERGERGAAVELTLFPDGRAIVRGTTEPETARSIYARYVGA